MVSGDKNIVSVNKNIVSVDKNMVSEAIENLYSLV
jgi:hypothetical protein